MKILITENQLEKVIYKFIEQEFNRLKEEPPRNGWRPWSMLDPELEDEYSEVFHINTEKNKIRTKAGFQIPIMEMFGIDYIKTCKVILGWARIHFNNSYLTY